MECTSWRVVQGFSFVDGYLPSTLEGGRIGDNSEYFAEAFGLFLVF